MKIRTLDRVPGRKCTSFPSLTKIAFVAVLVAVTAPQALAKGAAKGAAKGGHGSVKVAVPSFTGPGEAAVRAAVTRALQSKKVIVVSGGDLQDAAKKQHVRLDDNAGYKAVSESLGLTAIVTGELSKKKATLTLRSGEDGSVVDEVTFVGADPKKVAAVVGKTFWKRTASGFKKTKPPGGGGTSALAQQAESAAAEPEPADEPEPAGDSKSAADAPSGKKKAPAEGESDSETKTKAKASKEKEDKASEESSEAGSPEGADEALDVAVGLSDLLRSLTYNQVRNDLNPDSSAKAATYSLPKAPTLVAHVDFFPMAFSSTDLLSKVGLTVDLAYLLPVVTSPGVGGSYKTASLAWSAGLKVRLPYSLYVLAAYGDQWFKLTRSNASMAPAPIPTTDYKFARIGAGIRKHLTSSLSLMAAVGYDKCLGVPGQIGSSTYFPKVTCAAAEANVGLGYKVTPSIEVRGGVDWRRYGLAFHETPADVGMNRPIAGGALDQYTQIYVTVAYLIGGPSAGDDDEAKAGKSSTPPKADGDADDDKKDDDKKDAAEAE